MIYRPHIAPPRAFTRAKRQLKEEGFGHERRRQGPGGHWVTQQLVPNVPLSAAEAAKLLARVPVHAPPAPASARPSGRLAALRECEGEHVQATLFRPVGDETRCHRCPGSPPPRTAETAPTGPTASPAAPTDDWRGGVAPGERGCGRTILVP